MRERVRERIARRRGDVFLTREFRDLGGEDQVLRALRGLVRDGRLVRLGYGVHGRAEKSGLAGEPILAACPVPVCGSFGDTANPECLHIRSRGRSLAPIGVPPHAWPGTAPAEPPSPPTTGVSYARFIQRCSPRR